MSSARVNDSFQTTLRALGGKGTATFGLGFDTDPQGKAPNRVSAGAVVNGRSVYDARNINVGRDSGELQTRITLEAHRAMLAALQASDLPDDIGKLLNSLSAASATDEAIQKALKLASLYKQLDDLKLPEDIAGKLRDALDGTDEVTAHIQALAEAFSDVNKLIGSDALALTLEAVGKANADVYDSFKYSAEALRKQIDLNDDSTTGIQNLTAATLDYYRAQVNLLAQIEQVRDAVTSMFSDTVRSLTLTAFGDDKQAHYDYLRGEANNLTAQLATASDPETIRSLADRINSDITEAFGLLTPGQQQSQLQDFVNYANAVSEEANTRLTEVGQDVTQTVTETLNEVNVQLGKLIDNLQKAGITFQTAVDDFADTTIGVDFHADVPGTVDYEVNGG
jgi:hypothetical protein